MFKNSHTPLFEAARDCLYKCSSSWLSVKDLSSIFWRSIAHRTRKIISNSEKSLLVHWYILVQYFEQFLHPSPMLHTWREIQFRLRLNMVILTKISKIFIKAKLTVSKSYLLGLVCLRNFRILRGDLI